MRWWLTLVGLLCTVACGRNDGAQGRRAVVERYAEGVAATYAAAVSAARDLRREVHTFVDDPSEAHLESAKRAWLAAREPYGASEVFRFYDGPIDGRDGPEPRLNGWPIDESYVDYVEGAPNSGIINDRTIELDRAHLISLNEGGEGDIFRQGDAFDPDTAIATGLHAIEFVLWGQDHSDTGPGDRSHKDYWVSEGATAENGDRRGEYLRLVTELVVEDLETVERAWAPNADNYRARFVAGDPNERLRAILIAVGILAKAELAGERLDVPLTTHDQEDEHSCFSDNTHRDAYLNARSLLDVFRGEHLGVPGPGIDGLLTEADPELSVRLGATLEAAVRAAEEMPTPFDRAIARPDSPEWHRIDALVTLLFDVGDLVVDAGDALGLGRIDVSLPEVVSP